MSFINGPLSENRARILTTMPSRCVSRSYTTTNLSSSSLGCMDIFVMSKVSIETWLYVSDICVFGQEKKFLKKKDFSKTVLNSFWFFLGLTHTMEESLRPIYYAPGASRSAVSVYKRAKSAGLSLTLKNVKDFIEHQESHQLYVRKKTARQMFNPMHSVVPFWAFEADLCDMSKYKTAQKYILVVIDSFSDHTWLRSLNKKDASTVSAAFNSIFDTLQKQHHTPLYIRTDDGTEFKGLTNKVFLEFGVMHIIVPIAFGAERRNKDVKARLARYVEEYGTKNWANALQDTENALNNEDTRSVHMTPIQAENDPTSAAQYLTYKYLPSVVKTAPQLDVGDLVRKVLFNPKTNPFRKDHDIKNSRETFKITHVFEGRGGNSRYALDDDSGRMYNYNDLVPVKEPSPGPEKVQKTPVKARTRREMNAERELRDLDYGRAHSGHKSSLR